MSVTVKMTPNRPQPKSTPLCQVASSGFYQAATGAGLWYVDRTNRVFVSIGDNNFNVCKLQDIHDREVVPVQGMDIDIKISLP